MKRHESFRQLSSDHHEGLLLAIRLQQGGKALLRLWSHDLQWQAVYTVKFFEDHLVTHFDEEERVVFPAAEEHLVEHRAIVDRLRTEHDQMRAMIEQLRHPDTQTLETTLKEFGTMLEQHIRCEERKLFPLCEEQFPPQLMAALGAALQRHAKKGT